MVRVEDIVHSLRVVHYVFNPDHYIGIVIANTASLYKCHQEECHYRVCHDEYMTISSCFRFLWFVHFCLQRLLFKSILPTVQYLALFKKLNIDVCCP